MSNIHPAIKLLISNRKRCQCCNGKSEIWYCKECVGSGNFYHSKVKLPERFAEKKIRQRRFHQIFNDLESKVLAGDQRQIKKDCLQEEIKQTQDRIRLLNLVIQSSREKLTKASEERTRLGQHISSLKDNLPLFRKRLTKIQDNIAIYRERIEKKKSFLSHLEGDFRTLSRQRVNELTGIIFPLREISDEVSNDCDSDVDRVQMLLAEAVQTNYVEGQWIRSTVSSRPNRNYTLVSTVLPGSGDYSKFRISNYDDGSDEKRDSQNISAGLSYLCQMVNILAKYLGVHLPQRLHFSDFSEVSQQDLKGKAFEALICRLNANVLSLCASQRVPVSALQPHSTVDNIEALVNSSDSDLGRHGSFELDPSLLDLLGSSWVSDYGIDSDSESEWETVTSFPPMDFAHSTSPSFQGGQRKAGSDEDSAHSGIVSAAASVMSIFRGFTGSPQK